MIRGTENARGTAVIRWSGQYLAVTPACNRMLEALCSARHVAVEDTASGCRTGKAFEPLFRRGLLPEGKPAVVCSVALEPVVRKVLAEEGLTVQDLGRPRTPLPNAQHGPRTGLDPMDEQLLTLIGQHDRALVRYDPACVDPIRLIAQIALAWPDRSLAVAAGHVQQVRAVRNQLRKHLPNVVAVISRDPIADESVGRVVVATYTGLGHTGVEVEKRDIVVALNAMEALGSQSRWCLDHAHEARIYGLLDMHAGLAPYDRDRLVELFGFQEVAVPQHGWQERPVQVVQQRTEGLPPLAKDLSTLAMKRAGIWRNTVRNEHIARTARLLQHGKGHKREPHFPAIAHLLQSRTIQQVVVLVENVEHGQALQQLLPDWALITGPNAQERGAEGEGKLSRSAKGGGKRPYALVTFAGLPGMSLKDVDVLLRADGGMGLPPLPDGDLIHPVAESPQPLVLIDIYDKHHPRLRSWAEKREAAYAERGWWPVGVGPVEARVEHFLKTRPGRMP